MTQAEINCEHQYSLGKGIHKLIILNTSNAAVDDALAHLADILYIHPKNQPLFLLIDARQAVPPLQYFFSNLRRFYRSYESLPEIRAAYLYEKSLVLSMIQVFFKAIPMSANRHFLQGGTEEEAEAWLLSGED